jgi:hypothetical protein
MYQVQSLTVMLTQSPPFLPSDDILEGFSFDMVAARPPTAPEQEIAIIVRGLSRELKLAVDASPGCGGVTWPAGEVTMGSQLSMHLPF